MHCALAFVLPAIEHKALSNSCARDRIETFLFLNIPPNTPSTIAFLPISSTSENFDNNVQRFEDFLIFGIDAYCTDFCGWKSTVEY